MGNHKKLPKTVDLKFWSNLSIQERQSLPQIAAVYAVYYPANTSYCKAGTTIYIGRTLALRKRFQSHPGLTCLTTVRIAWFELDAIDQAAVESALIKKHKPSSNIQHHRRPKPVVWGTPECKKLMSSL